MSPLLIGCLSNNFVAKVGSHKSFIAGQDRWEENNKTA